MAKPQLNYAENEKKGHTCDVLCIKCNVETEHHVLYSYDVSGSETVEIDSDGRPYDICWGTSHQTIRCGGCKTVTYREESYFSEDEGTDEVLYPARTTGKLIAKDFHNAPTALRRIYRETIEAFNSECLTLCAGGLRAIVEGICADKKIEKGPVEVDVKGVKTIKQMKNLDGKISGLREKGFLTEPNARVLHTHRYLGNEALHDLQMPSVDELRLAIDIIEHVLVGLYTIEDKAHEIEWRRKQRQTGLAPSIGVMLRGKIPNNK
jgi:Domain of unknown function (DUF4145)